MSAAPASTTIPASPRLQRARSELYVPTPAWQTHMLVDAETGEELVLPARKRCWDGVEIVVRDFKPSRFEDNPGYIYTALNETFVPSVVGCKIVARAAL